MLLASTGVTALAIAAAATSARAGDFDLFIGLGTLGGTTSKPNGISADGTVVVGESTIANGTTRAFRWSGGVMTDLGTLGGNSSWANQTSADGAVVVGHAETAASATHAFRWSGGVMTDLGTLGGSTSMGFAVSANGAIVAGQSTTVGNAATHAFRYSNGVMADLGTLGGTFSSAFGISADGSVVVGRSTIANGDSRPFRWSNGVMTDLGTFGGNYSSANGVSADGSVVVGYSRLTGNTGYRAFRWSNGVMADLGTANGGTSSLGIAVSADGSVVVGYSNTAGNSAYRAMRWTAATGMKLIGDLLTASGVNTTGWVLTAANGVSADGSVIVGTGTNPSGNTEAWIARCSPGCALLSSGTVARSFAGQSAIGQTASAAIGFTLGTMTEVATQTNSNRNDGSRYSVFGYGGYDTDPAASGTLGMTASLSDKIVAGALVSANAVRTDMVYDGKARMAGASLGGFVARAPDAGLQWLFSVAGITLDGDVTRGYLNASSPAFSQGHTGGNGYGATARVGWTFDQALLRGTQMTPFASYTWSRMDFNGYTETGGPFPARFQAFNDAAQIVRVGVDTRYTFAPGTWAWGTIAAAHRLSGSTPSSINGTIIGLFDQTAPAAPVAKDWAEATAGLRWQTWRDGAINASVTAVIPANYPVTYQLRVGFSQRL